MVNVTDGADVAMRLVTFELFLGHGLYTLMPTAV
jgi:hypothetical protein